MKKKLFLTVAGLNIIWLTSCISGINNTNSSGYLYASVKFPDNKFSVKFIPSNTDVINVQVEGTGLSSPIKFDLTRNDSSKVIADVPSGDKLVKAIALDANGKTVAQGQNSVNVIAKTFNKVEITLEAVNIDTPVNNVTPTPDNTVTATPSADVPLPTPSPSPISGNSSPSPTPKPVDSGCMVKIPLSDYPLSKSLEQSILDAGCKIISPTPSPTPSISSGGGGGGGGAQPDAPVQDIPISVSVRTASPIPSGVTIN